MSVYLDHAATTPLRPEARDAWLSAHEVLGNPSSIHGAGQAARRLARHRRSPGALLAGPAPAHAPWCFVPAAEHPASATAIRAAAAAAGGAALPRPAPRRTAREPTQMQTAAAAAT